MIGSLVQNRPDPRGGVILQRQDTRLVEIVRATSIEGLEAAEQQLAGVEMREGARGQVRVEGPGLGILARAAGMEQLWGSRFAPAGARVIDVRGEGFNTAVTDFEAPRGFAPAGFAPQGFAILIPLLIVGLISVLLAAGMGFFQSVALLIERLGESAVPLGLGFVLVAGAVIAVLVVASGRKGRSRSP